LPTRTDVGCDPAPTTLVDARVGNGEAAVAHPTVPNAPIEFFTPNLRALLEEFGPA